MSATHNDLDRKKVGIREIGLLNSLYQNKSSRVLRNGRDTCVLLFGRP